MLNKVNYSIDPRTLSKKNKESGKSLGGWKRWQNELNKTFNPAEPFYVVTGDAGGHNDLIVVIDMDGISKEDLEEDNLKFNKAREAGKKYTKKYKNLPFKARKRIMDGKGYGTPNSLMDRFMEVFDLPHTYTVTTASGFKHLYYKVKEDNLDINNSALKRFFKNVAIDIRGQGGLVYGVGTQFKDTARYSVDHGTEDDIAQIEGWKVLRAGGCLNFGVAGVHLGEFIAGNVDPHEINLDLEFIVWREAMYLLKSIGYTKKTVDDVFSEIPGYDQKTTINQIDAWWDYDDNPDKRKIQYDKLEYGEKPAGVRKTKEKLKKRGGSHSPSTRWYHQFENWWNDKYENVVYHERETDSWVCYRESDGMFVDFPAKSIDYEIMEFFDEFGMERKTEKINLAIRTLKAKISKSVKDFDANKRYRLLLNGVLDRDTMEILEFSHEYLFKTRYYANFKLEPAETPYMDRVRASYPDQLFRIERFIQMVLQGDMSNDLELYIYGATGSGKGVITNLLSELFKDVASFSSNADLGGEFGLSPLVGKKVNIDPEMSIVTFNPKAVRRKKKIIGGDRRETINIKKVKQFMYDFDEFFFINATNQFGSLPSGTDIRAWFRRTLLVWFNITQKKDPKMKREIMNELDD